MLIRRTKRLTTGWSNFRSRGAFLGGPVSLSHFQLEEQQRSGSHSILIFETKFWLVCQIGNIGVDQEGPMDPSGIGRQTGLYRVAMTIDKEEQRRVSTASADTGSLRSAIQ